MYTHCVYSSICIQFNLEIGSAVQMFSDNSSLLNIRCRTADVNTSSDGSDIKKEREGTFVFPAFSYFLQFLPFFPSGEMCRRKKPHHQTIWLDNFHCVFKQIVRQILYCFLLYTLYCCSLFFRAY